MMNRSCLFLAAALLLPVGIAVGQQTQQKSTKALSPYEQAVQQYVNAAHAEVEAYQTKLETATKDKSEEEVARYQDAQRKLDRLEEAFKALAEARQNDFDARKLAYERARAELLKALEKAAAR